MTPRRVLLVSYHFPPSAAVAVHRMLGLVRYLPELGWQPVVIAPPRLPWEPEDRALLDQVPRGTPVCYVPFRSGGVINRVAAKVMPLLRWYPDAKKACARTIAEHEPAALITSSPPGCVHYLGLAVKRRHRLPWIACLRDPWVTNWRADRPLSWKQRCEKSMEARVMRHADAVVANTPLNLLGLQAAYPEQARKMESIVNGFDPESFAGLPPPPTTTGRPDRLTLLHAGELYAGRDPRPFLDAVRALRAAWPPELPPLHVEFLGTATEGMFDLRREIGARGLEDCVIALPHVPYAEALARMRQASMLLLIHSPGFKVGVPAKLYEYLGAARPVLALAPEDGDVAWVLRESGTPHRLAPMDDVDRIQTALRDLSRQVSAGEQATGDTARLAPFTRRAMAQRFAARLDALVGGAAERLPFRRDLASSMR